MIRPVKQTGYILLPVIVVITLVAAIALLMNTESALESNTASGELDAQQARYVAEAGLNHALWLTQQQGCGPYSDLTDAPLGNDKYTTSLTTDLGSTNDYTLPVDQDTWIRDDFPTNNYAADSKMHIRNQAGIIERPLLRYDLSAIPAKAAILSAQAWFYANEEHSEGPVDIHLITADWTDTDATWDSMGAYIDNKIVASVPTEPASGVWVSVNLTAQVQAWINGEPNYGITINTSSAGVHSEYLSSESAFPPYIEVLVGTPPTSPAKLKSTSKLDGGGVAKIERDDVYLYQSPPSYVQRILNDGAGQDAMLNSFYNSRNYGDHELQVSIGSGSTIEKSLLQFKLPAIPPGAEIISARLELYHYVTSGTPVDPGVDVHRVTRSWVEGTKDGTGSADGATWLTWDGSSSWTQSGGDYDPAAVASSDISAAINDWESWDIGELVRGWIDGRFQNHGLILNGTGVLDVSFASQEDADPALHPRLSITYACACGEICVTPQGSGNLLMVVVNPTVLVAEDQQAEDLFESWGYTVSVISESANQSTYDAAVAANDVVFISETVNSNSVGSKLVNAPIGVVSQDGDYNPDLGLATGSTLKVGSDIDITGTDHYITRVFALGPLPVYAAGMEQLVTTGAFTADQQSLAEIGGDPSLVALNQGALMEGGGTATGRRVILPLGTRYRFNWDYLNANGRLLVQRALAWASGAVDASAGNVLLVVVNPGSLTAQEDAKKALIEGWDYTVNLIDESDSQATFDAAIAVNDVAYISQDITSSNLGTKLRAATIGVVNEEGEQVDELGFSGDKIFKSRREIDVVDNSHYITLPFSVGLLEFISSDQSVHMLSGQIAPGLQILGESFNTGSQWKPSLATLDPGDDLSGGGTAAGRRVELPWGGGSFDIDQLNDDGRTIMQRALAWGAGTEDPDFSTELLFVVADPAALTGAEAAKQSLIESWGYTVNLIDDADSVANFVAAFGINGVIYISGEVSDTAVGSKLFKTTLGVVNEQIALHDELLLSTSAATNDFSNISVVDNGHYITQGIATGWHTIATSNQPLNALMGTLAPGLANLAEVWISGANYDFGLAVVDTGAELNAGEFAAGRRVQLPWGTAGFDFSALNANGEDLMRRAIEWAGGAEIDLSPVAHWKLDDATGLNAIDSEGSNDGTLNGPPDWVAGLIGDALDFDGSNDYVDAGTFDVIGSGITMMGWFNAQALTTADERIISKAAGTAEADAWWQLSSSNSGSDRFLRMRIKAGGTTTTLGDSSANLSTGTWYLATATYDNASGTMRLYLDDAEVASTTHAVGGALDTDASVPVAIGANGSAERFFNGVLDDVRVYDRALSASEISDLYAASAPEASSYTELYQPWSATSNSTWQTVELAPFGVPANAVVEVAISNSNTGKERLGGVRAAGSTLQRRFDLHEAEGGGIDTVTMHVQADASGRIEHYSEWKADVTFILLGYWTGASYVERFDAFKAGANASWQSHNLGAYGVGPGQVAEIALSQTSTSIEWLVGARRPGSGLTRLLPLHEAENGGIDMVTLMTGTDASSIVEVYAGADTVVDFHLLGYWSTPPGSYTETGDVHGQATVSASWQTTDLSGLGIPANSVAQFVMSNEIDDNENQMGLRESGSTIPDRRLDLQEAESGGGDLGTMHVKVDASSQIQWFAEYGAGEGFFYPLGWWVLSP